MLTSPAPDAPAYPGTNASAAEILALANAYREAALWLFENGPRGSSLKRAPFRLCAIHAVELYFNADLLTNGMAPQEVRAHMHNLTVRARLALESGMVLDGRTAEHLQKLTDNREYLVNRYGPELLAACSNPTRLKATLEEIAEIVTQRVLSAA